jgi:hypothetical protein
MILPSFTYHINNPQHSTLVTSEELEMIITGNPKQIYITDEDVFHNHRIYFSEKNTIVLKGGERNKNLDYITMGCSVKVISCAPKINLKNCEL